MKLKTAPSTGIISVLIDTPKGHKTVSLGTSDKKEAKQLIKVLNIQSVEALSKSGQITQELIRKLTVSGSLTVSHAITKWEEWIRATAGSDRTADSHIMYARAWARDTKMANRTLNEVTESVISKWVNDPKASQMLSTRRVMLAALRSLFRFCSIRSYLNPDPAREVRVKAKLLSHEQKEARKKVPFTPGEFKQVVDYITEKIVEHVGSDTDAGQRRLQSFRFWYCATIIGRYAGLRLGDICSLEWATMKTPGKLIVWTDKKDTRVELPIGKELAKGISSIPPNRLAHCFPVQNEIINDAKSRAMLSVQFGRILEGAGVEGHSFHDLRHTLASELNAKGETLEAIAEALGHTSTKSTEGYIH